MTTANASCPLAIAPATIATWRDGALASDESTRIAAHVSGCEACRREIAGANRAEIPAAVHATRKHIKKARALLRLVRDELGKEVFKEENRRLRDVARSFSSSRDACVRLQVLERLHDPIGNDGTFAGF